MTQTRGQEGCRVLVLHERCRDPGDRRVSDHFANAPGFFFSLASTVQYLNHHDKIRKRVGQMIVLSCWRGSVCMPLVDIGEEARPNRHGVRLVRPGKSRVDRCAEIDINGTCGSGETKETTTPGTVDAPRYQHLPLLWFANALQMRADASSLFRPQVVYITR